MWCLATGRFIDHDDQQKGTIWALVDLTWKKHLQDTLQANLAERKAILDTVQVGLQLVRQGYHVWCNRQMETIMGYQNTDLQGRHISEWFGDPEGLPAILANEVRRMDRGETVQFEHAYQHPDGRLRWHLVTGRRIDSNDPAKGAIWSRVDLSSQKQAEEEIKRALAREKELSDLKTRFVSMASHEFRTPLSTIQSSVELLSHYRDELPAEEQAELFTAIEDAVRHMTQMMEDVLLLGKTAEGKLRPNPAPMPLRTFCESLIHTQQRLCNGSHLLQLDYAGPEGMVMLDQKLLHLVLNNLLRNAVKYSPGGREVEFKVWQSEAWLRLSVRDRGIGIPAEDLPHLFESFFRASNVGRISGTGLGLHIVKSAVEACGGQIDVDSVAGEGTLFTVQFPLIPA